MPSREETRLSLLDGVARDLFDEALRLEELDVAESASGWFTAPGPRIERLAAARSDTLRRQAARDLLFQAQNMRALGAAVVAARTAAKVLEMDPDCIMAYKIAAEVALDRRQFEEARATVERGLERDPTAAELWHIRAQACLALDDLDAAATAIATASRIEPGGNWTATDVQIRWARDDREGATKVARALMEAQPEQPLGYYWVGAALCMEKKFEEAVRYLEKARDLGSGMPFINAQLAKAYADLGRRDEARAEYLKVLEA